MTAGLLTGEAGCLHEAYHHCRYAAIQVLSPLLVPLLPRFGSQTVRQGTAEAEPAGLGICCCRRLFTAWIANGAAGAERQRQWRGGGLGGGGGGVGAAEWGGVARSTMSAATEAARRSRLPPGANSRVLCCHCMAALAEVAAIVAGSR